MANTAETIFSHKAKQTQALQPTTKLALATREELINIFLISIATTPRLASRHNHCSIKPTFRHGEHGRGNSHMHTKHHHHHHHQQQQIDIKFNKLIIKGSQILRVGWFRTRGTYSHLQDAANSAAVYVDNQALVKQINQRPTSPHLSSHPLLNTFSGMHKNR